VLVIKKNIQVKGHGHAILSLQTMQSQERPMFLFLISKVLEDGISAVNYVLISVNTLDLTGTPFITQNVLQIQEKYLTGKALATTQMTLSPFAQLKEICSGTPQVKQDKQFVMNVKLN